MKWSDALAFTLVMGVIGLLGFGLTRSPDDVPSPLVGEAAPSFRLERLAEGDSLGLADLAGRPVVVNFWASWCLACIQEHPALMRARNRYRDRGVEMIGIVYQDSPENARRYVRERGGDWAQLVDPGTRVAIDFGVYGVPETFFIDAAGLIAHKHIGPVDDDVMTTQIEALLRAPFIEPLEAGGTNPRREEHP